MKSSDKSYILFISYFFLKYNKFFLCNSISCKIPIVINCTTVHIIQKRKY